MIIAKTLSLIQNNGFKKDYTNVTQIYCVGNQLVISGQVVNEERYEINITDKYMLSDLEVMIVNFQPSIHG